MTIDAYNFDDCLARGIGRVVPYLRENDSRPFRDVILHACSHNLAFDRQTESLRCVYLYDLIDATGEPGYYIPRLVEMLDSSDDLCFAQLYDLMGQLAAHGYDVAREALYGCLAADTAVGSLSAAEAVVELDGIKGYLVVADYLMRHPIPPDDETKAFNEYWLLHRAIERDGEDIVAAELAGISAMRPELGNYIARVDLDRRAWQTGLSARPKLPPMPYEELRGLINDTSSKFVRVQWWGYGRRATMDTLVRIADELATVTDRETQLRMIHLFHHRPVQRAVDALLAFAISADLDVRQAALSVLRKQTDVRIRELALTFLASEQTVRQGMELLALNGTEADYSLVRDIVAGTHSDDDFHRIGIDARRFIECNPSPSAAGMLVDLYERGRCTMCRCSVVRLMIDTGTIPQSVVQEGVYDAHLETRRIIKDARIAAKG